MKKLVSVLLTLTLLLAMTTFSGAAIPAQVDHAAHDLHRTCRSVESPASVQNADICPNPECREKAFVYKCNQECLTSDTGTHTYKLTKTCTITYTTSQTLQVCNVCGYRESLGWHPMCDELHSSCGLGHYPTCTIFLY